MAKSEASTQEIRINVKSNIEEVLGGANDVNEELIKNSDQYAKKQKIGLRIQEKGAKVLTNFHIRTKKVQELTKKQIKYDNQKLAVDQKVSEAATKIKDTISDSARISATMGVLNDKDPKKAKELGNAITEILYLQNKLAKGGLSEKSAEDLKNQILTAADNFDKLMLEAKETSGIFNDIGTSIKQLDKAEISVIDPEYAKNLQDNLKGVNNEAEKSKKKINGLNDALSDPEKSIVGKKLIDQMVKIGEVADPANLTEKEKEKVLEKILELLLAEEASFSNINKKAKGLVSETEDLVAQSEKELDVIKAQDDLAKRKDIKTKEQRKKEKFFNALAFKELKKQNIGVKDRIKAGYILNQGLGGMAKKTKDVAKAGKDIGSAVLSPFQGLFGMIGKLLPGLAGLTAIMGIAGFAGAMLMAEKKTKDARREFLGMAADSGELDTMTKKSGKGFDVASSRIEQYRLATMRYTKTLGLSMDDAQKSFGDLEKAGFKMEDITARSLKKVDGRTIATKDTFKEFYAQSVLTGKSMEELAQTAGTFREEFGYAIDQTTNAFVGLRKDAREAGMATGRFMDKVINAAAGMGIYGTKIEDVGSLFAKLKKNMKMPEKEATEAVSGMIGGWDKLSAEQQITAVQTTKLGQEMMKNVQLAKTGTDEQKKAAKAYIASRLSGGEADAEALISITDPLSQQLEIARKSKVGQKFLMTFEEMSVKMGKTIDVNKTSMGEIKDIFKNNKFALAKVAQEMNLTPIALEKLVEGMPDDSSFAALGDAQEAQAQAQEDAAKAQEDAAKASSMRMQTQSFTDALEQSIAVILQQIFAFIEPAFNIAIKFLKMIGKVLMKFAPYALKLLSKVVWGVGKLVHVYSSSAGDTIMKAADSLEEQAGKMNISNAIDDLATNIEENQEKIKANNDLMEKEKSELKKLNAKGKDASEEDKNRIKQINDDINVRNDQNALMKQNNDAIRTQIKAQEKLQSWTGSGITMEGGAEDQSAAAQKAFSEQQKKFGETLRNVKPIASAPKVEVKTPNFTVAAPDVKGGGTAIGGDINDNRQITINVNQRDKEFITQVVRGEMYTDKMKH